MVRREVGGGPTSVGRTGSPHDATSVGCCWVPAADAGMAEGWVLRPGREWTRHFEDFGSAQRERFDVALGGLGRILQRGWGGPTVGSQAVRSLGPRGRGGERRGRGRSSAGPRLRAAWATRQPGPPGGSPRTRMGWWLRGRRAGQRRRPYERGAGCVRTAGDCSV